MNSSDWRQFDESRNRANYIDGLMARGYSDQAALAAWAGLQKRIATERRGEGIWFCALALAFGVALVVYVIFT